MRWLTIALGLGACGKNDVASDGADGDADTDADTDTDTDTDADTDTDSDTDTDTPPGSEGLLVRVGTLVYDGSAITGEERLTLIGDSGYGAAVCTLHYSVASTAARNDCTGCIWAFDVVYSAASVEIDDGACLAATSYDAANIADLDGVTGTRGYNPDYVGHAEVVMSQVDGAWAAVTYGDYDPATGTLTYEWEDGFVGY